MSVGNLCSAIKDLGSMSFTPTEVTQRGHTSTTTTISVKFSTTTQIPNNGSIIVTLESSWAFTDRTLCSQSGLPVNTAADGPAIA